MQALLVAFALIAQAPMVPNGPGELEPEPARVPPQGVDVVDDEPTAPDVEGEPAANEASGQSVKEDESHPLLWIPRVVLFPVRVLYEIPGQTLKGTAWLLERYRLRDKYDQIFFNEDGTIGLFPTALLETGFGLNVGLRFVDRNLFGHNEALSARVGYGGQFRQALIAQFRSGTLFGEHFRIEALAGNDARPKARFWGVGNAGHVRTPIPGGTLDPYEEPFAVSTRYSETRTRAQSDFRVLFNRYFSTAATVAWMIQGFGACASCISGDDSVANASANSKVNIKDVYDTSKLVGFDSGLSNVSYMLSLTYDSREPANDFIPKPTPSSGWRVNAYGGRTLGYASDPSRFSRLGADIARIFNIFRGDRTLTLRLYVESVIGTLSHIPFVSLPQLGGNYVLRGEQIGRYRDRNAGSFQTEYMWSLNQAISAFVFCDVGRVWRNADDFTFKGLHPGGGFGLQAHTMKTFLMRFMLGYNGEYARVAVSIDPLYDTSPRAEW